MNIVRTVFERNNLVYNNTLVGTLSFVLVHIVSLPNSSFFSCQRSTSSFIIESLGPVFIEQSCFHNNSIGVSNIAVFGSSFDSMMVHINNSKGNKCRYAAVFETLEQFDTFTPVCTNTWATTCSATMDVTRTVETALLAESVGTPLKAFGPNPVTKMPLGLCEGDCDNNSECKTGLVCFNRTARQAVPGCIGGETDNTPTDYCILDPAIYSYP